MVCPSAGKGGQFAVLSSANRLFYGTVAVGRAVEVCIVVHTIHNMYTHTDCSSRYIHSIVGVESCTLSSTALHAGYQLVSMYVYTCLEIMHLINKVLE